MPIDSNEKLLNSGKLAKWRYKLNGLLVRREKAYQKHVSPIESDIEALWDEFDEMVKKCN